MSARKSTFGFLAAALVAASLSTAAPAKAAPLVVTSSKFSLTFQDGWSMLPFTSDSIKFVMNAAAGGTAYMTAVPSSGELTAQQIAAYIAMYGQSDSIVQTANGTKTLGGKSFSYVEFKDTENPDDRVRFFYYSNGTMLFHLSAIYEVAKTETVVAQVEAALATLNLQANTGLRAAALRFQGVRPARHDVLGRSAGSARPARLFRVPAF